VQILYCDTCGFRIDEDDVQKAQAGGQVVCAKCRAAAGRAATGVGARKSSAKIVPVAAAATGSKKSVEAVRKTGHALGHARAEGGSNGIVIVVVVLLVVGGAGAFLATRGGSKPKPPEQGQTAKTPLGKTPAANVETPKGGSPAGKNDPPKLEKITQPAPLPEPKDPPPDKNAAAAAAAFEKEAEAEFDKVMKFAGLAEDDVEGRIKLLQEFIDKYANAFIVFRAKAEQRKLRELHALPKLHVSSDPPLASLSDGLLAHWRFEAEADGKVAAEFPKDASAALVGAKLSEQVPPVPFGNQRSLALAAEGDHLKIGTPFKDVTNTFSIAAWVLPEAERNEAAEANTEITGTAGQRYAIFPVQGAVTFGDGHATAGLSVGTNGVSVYEHSHSYMPAVLVYPVVIKRWVHITLVYDKHQPKLYLNGKQVKTGLTSAMTVHPTHQFGDHQNYGPFVGKLDEVRIYNRALTDAEVLSLAAAKEEKK